MKCQICGIKNATTHIKNVCNDEVQELHLCTACAAKSGYSNLMNGFNLNFGDLIGSMFGTAGSLEMKPAPESCTFCHASFEDFVRTGKAGCSNCYETFYEKLLPSLQRIHGRTEHVGKVPASASNQLKTKRTLDALRKELNEAVASQEFEKAAVLRDQINELEQNS